MRVMYVAPAFHPNQAPIVKGWKESGTKVKFVAQYAVPIENRADCVPIILGYSFVFQLFLKYYSRKKNLGTSAYPEAVRDLYGFPPIMRALRLLYQFRPDVVILRERSIYSIVFNILCRMLKIKTILYNQTPMWDEAVSTQDFAHKVVYRMAPRTRITPVLGKPGKGQLHKNTTYVPFVIEPMLAPDEKQYFLGDRINIICIGKYEVRKNQKMLVEYLASKREHKIHLTLVGQVSTSYHQQCYQEITELIEKYGLQDKVSCFVNVNPLEIGNFYKNADLFVLPSTNEFASISQLEAMSYSLPVIISDTNGSACYIEEGKNGFLFHDNQQMDLFEKLDRFISDKMLIIRMGEQGYQMSRDRYSFKKYEKSIKKIICQNRD
ncbi:MAG: glycosyltransferase family 4 protein [Lachnospiraceae bacterium]|nr:glycosyltransferase family 4 protein [Lachnospiraceae bacterium]